MINNLILKNDTQPIKSYLNEILNTILRSYRSDKHTDTVRRINLKFCCLVMASLWPVTGEVAAEVMQQVLIC